MTGPSLTGRSIVVTRAEYQAQPLVSAIREAGGLAIELPLIEITPPPDDGRALADALALLKPDDWLVVLSPNGARSVLECGSPLPTCRLAVLAGGTTDVFREVGWVPDLVPTTASSVGLLDAFPPQSRDERVLIAQAVHGRRTMEEGLAEAGWEVEVVAAYDNEMPDLDSVSVEAARTADVVVFASPSAVDRYVANVGRTPKAAVCIGEVTAESARINGFDVTVASAPTTDALMHTLLEYLTVD